LGPRGAPLLRDSADVPRADCVFLESTYGDRDHRSFDETVDEMTALVKSTLERRGKILVPSFAVGRTQTILYLLTQKFRQGQLPTFPIYIDSPMAIEATRLYQIHPELLDEEALRLRAELQAAGAHEYYKASVTADDSRALNDLPGPCLILAGAGMCNAGRILHHFKQNLWRPETTVLIVGYQSPESLGRLLLDGAKQVSIFGEKIAVRATVRALGGFSAHAGQTDLLRWFAPMAHCRPQVVLTHGESKGRDALAKEIQQRYGLRALLPKFGDRIELAGPTCPE
jgi:metallo-beta-lactamase family protein